MKPLKLRIPGFSIAGIAWGKPNKPTILALHGWLDNANSFAYLAPYLEKDFHVLAVDLPGHGHSSHLPEGQNYHFTDGIYIIIDLINALNLDKVHLLGHSMGACLASLVAGVVPERLRSLSLIEGLGPFSHPADTACQQLTKYAHFRMHKSKVFKAYDDLNSAALARAQKGYISLDLAKTLCERGLIKKQGQCYWRHDSRLLVPSPLRMTEEQILSCLQEITVKTCLLAANQGFSFDSSLIKNRINAVKNLTVNEVEGGHHIHMEQPEVISKLLTDFILTSD